VTRFLAPALIAVLIAALFVLHHEHHDLAAVPSGPFSRSEVAARAVEAVPTVSASPHRASRPRPHRCTDQHWKRTLHPAERWIDAHESGLNPDAVEPTTGAYGLGQLLPSTYATLGLPMSASPCAQIAAQRAYMHRHWGSWSNALAHWEANRWW
jgi:hypothetical protein